MPKQEQILVRIFDHCNTFKHIDAVHSKAVVMMLLINSSFIFSRYLWGLVFGPCFVIVSFLVLQSTR